METQNKFSFDVFLSHNSADKPKVRWLAENLKSARLKVWFDEWVIKPGDDIYLAIERGLESSRCLALCISDRALRSNWVSLERSTVIFRDPTNVERRFIPLLLTECQIPDAIRRYKYIDLKIPSNEALQEVITAIIDTNALTEGDFHATLSSIKFQSPISFVTDAFRILGQDVELDFSIWNGTSRRILLTSIGIIEYHSEQTIHYSGYYGRYGLELSIANDLEGLSYKIDQDDVLPFSVKIIMEQFGGGYIKLFGLDFRYSDSSGRVKKGVSDSIYMAGNLMESLLS